MSTGVEYICNRNPQAQSGYLTSLEHKSIPVKALRNKTNEQKAKQNKIKQTNKQKQKKHHHDPS